MKILSGLSIENQINYTWRGHNLSLVKVGKRQVGKRQLYILQHQIITLMSIINLELTDIHTF